MIQAVVWAAAKKVQGNNCSPAFLYLQNKRK
jgi:hypothetical protein